MKRQNHPNWVRSRLSYAGAAIAITMTATLAQAQDGERFYCWSDGEALKIFDSPQWKSQENYDEYTGARVQREHPNTYLVGQIKYVKQFDFINCQYSNHVGLVFSVFMRPAAIDPSDYCNAPECRARPHWRSEWIEDDPSKDRPDATHLDVCVVERNGVAYPSVGCAYKIIAK